MTESLKLNQSESNEETTSNIEFKRQQVMLSFIEKGLITEDFYKSGAIEVFDIDNNLGRDALLHMLVGDEYGGAHHIPSIMALDSSPVRIASLSQDDGRLRRTYSKGDLRREQTERSNGVFKSLDVLVVDDEGRELQKSGGSVMFPNDWNTEKVIRAVIKVSQVPGEIRQDNHAIKHIAKVDDVQIIVVTDIISGKILTGFPK